MALIPPFFLDCVVAIGLLAADGSKLWVASGFLYGDFVDKVKENGEEKKVYRIYLVTNRHVLEGKKVIYLRFNPKDAEPAREFDLVLEDGGKKIWFAHPDPQIDLAVVPINAKMLEKEGIQFSYFRSDEHTADRKKAGELGITEGDLIYVLGFPLGLVGGERNFVIVRQGSIARVRDALAGKNKEFLIDAFIFPGNSGGPVVTKPEIVSIQGTSAVSSAYLIGVVKSYVSYQEVAISEQTRRPRVVFEENSGLAAVVLLDFVREAIAEQLKAVGQPK